MNGTVVEFAAIAAIGAVSGSVISAVWEFLHEYRTRKMFRDARPQKGTGRASLDTEFPFSILRLKHRLLDISEEYVAAMESGDRTRLTSISAELDSVQGQLDHELLSADADQRASLGVNPIFKADIGRVFGGDVSARKDPELRAWSESHAMQWGPDWEMAHRRHLPVGSAKPTMRERLISSWEWLSGIGSTNYLSVISVAVAVTFALKAFLH